MGEEKDGKLKRANVVVRAWYLLEESIIISTVPPKAKILMRVKISKDFGHNTICLRNIIRTILSLITLASGYFCNT